jgi:hypothetical protein
MNVFKEELEHRRDRNRNYRFGGWSGILLKIFIIIVLLWVINNFTKDNVENMFQIFGVKGEKNEISNSRLSSH